MNKTLTDEMINDCINQEKTFEKIALASIILALILILCLIIYDLIYRIIFLIKKKEKMTEVREEPNSYDFLNEKSSFIPIFIHVVLIIFFSLFSIVSYYLFKDIKHEIKYDVINTYVKQDEIKVIENEKSISFSEDSKDGYEISQSPIIICTMYMSDKQSSSEEEYNIISVNKTTYFRFSSEYESAYAAVDKETGAIIDLWDKKTYTYVGSHLKND